MSVDITILLFPIVFMIHEFEEIIFVKAWFATHKNNPAMKRHYWVVGFRKYPMSTATFAVLISEEFIIVCALTLATLFGGFYALFAGLLIAYAAHLIMHSWDLIRCRGYVPGGPSALVTLPIILWMIQNIVTQTSAELWQIIVWTILIGIGLILNLKLLYKMSPVVERFLYPTSSQKE